MRTSPSALSPCAHRLATRKARSAQLEARRGAFFSSFLGLLLVASPLLARAESAVPLVWQFETVEGKVLDSRQPEQGINPASVVKLATSLRALEKLGHAHRFVTTIGIAGERQGGGSVETLVVQGGADPDFHFENAVLLGRALRDAGITRVTGDLYLGEDFWMGWERGTAGREPDPVKRRKLMGERLLQAWTPVSWTEEQRRAWSEVAGRRGWEKSKVPEITLNGRIRLDAPPTFRPIVVHRSQPLITALRRFNVFSNNDIERLDASTGPAAAMAAFFQSRWGSDADGMSFSTSSGLNRNRMTPRQVVHLLRDLRAWLAQRKLRPSDVMAILGCGQSTLPELFPKLAKSHDADGLAGKTGTLNTQDGGVSALAGILPLESDVLFFVAAPGAGKYLWKARQAEEDWVQRVPLRHGPLATLVCPPPVPTSDANAELEVVRPVS